MASLLSSVPKAIEDEEGTGDNQEPRQAVGGELLPPPPPLLPTQNSQQHQHDDASGEEHEGIEWASSLNGLRHCRPPPLAHQHLP